MGCCSSEYIDYELENAQNMPEIIKLMKKRFNKLLYEKNEIEDHLKDPSKEVSLIKIDDLSKDDLEKRIPYLEKLHDAYDDVIETLEHIDLPIDETKNHLNNIMSNRFITYDLNEKYKDDVSKFKQFAFENEKRMTEGFSKPLPQ